MIHVNMRQIPHMPRFIHVHVNISQTWQTIHTYIHVHTPEEGQESQQGQNVE